MSRKRNAQYISEPEPRDADIQFMTTTKAFTWRRIWADHPCKEYAMFFYNRLTIRPELQAGSYVLFTGFDQCNEFKIAGTTESISQFLANNEELDPSRITLDNTTNVLRIQGNAGTSLSIHCHRPNVFWKNDRLMIRNDDV